MEKTYYPKASEIDRKWFIADADGKTLGRFAASIAHVLLGKHKPSFTPGVEMGDYVVVINAERVAVTGTRSSVKLDTKMYHHHSGFPGGLKSVSLRDQLARPPGPCPARRGVGYAPAQQMGRAVLKRLKVYGGAAHPHEVQNPQPLNVDQVI